ncbi:MarR family transcriptional regulator (plasmid) [Radiobacillus kanasensis]|uniref:MarR family winged helix-turn-helix transcriptional regulator n=1 Tax=Radiobacillus kanasensis TaxID=2844358 RepID=UPI001E358E1C|nr:MarR family transcriptional regulator [Radiobacillus kanasensis]UFU01485.1 MarR family transcriptional regulator [Radiobacillus kanasensis]
MDKNEKINRIIQSFRAVNRNFLIHVRSNAKDLGVTTLQLQILRILHESPDIGLIELANKVATSKSTVSETVERLVKAGYIERNRSMQDRRALVMRLTEDGVLQKVEAYKEYMERLSGLHALDDHEVELLLSLHEKIIKNIKTDGDEQNG